MKYKLKDDWYFGTYKVRSKGDIIEFDENLEFEFSYMNNTIKISSNDIKDDPIFSEIEEVILDIKEIDDDTLDKVGNWRIQLDVKTSMRKLKLIEKFIKENINDML